MNPALSNPFLVKDVIAKRGTAFAIDLIVIAVVELFLGTFLAVFGLLTLGLGWQMLAVMPAVPFCYHFVTVARWGRTPGQGFTGLSVRRIDDLAPPTIVQALVWTAGLYATLATSGILLLVVFATEGRRTLHDIVAGLILVRTEALTPQPFGYEIGGGTYHP